MLPALECLLKSQPNKSNLCWRILLSISSIDSISIDFSRYLCFLPKCIAKCHLQPLAAPIWEVWALWVDLHLWVCSPGYCGNAGHGGRAGLLVRAGTSSFLYVGDLWMPQQWQFPCGAIKCPFNCHSPFESFNALCHVGLKSTLASIFLGPLLWVAQTSSGKHTHTQSSFLFPRSITNQQVIIGDFVHLTD